MHFETLVFLFKAFIILFYVVGSVVFFNPLINIFDLGRSTNLKYKIESFFYQFGVFGYWAVFTRMTTQNKDTKLTVKTSKGDHVWYFMKDHSSDPFGPRIPFLDATNDNTWVLLVHTINSWGPCKYDTMFYKKLLKRAQDYYAKENIDLLEFKLETVGLKYGCDRNYMHDLSLQPHFRAGTMFYWSKESEKEIIPKIEKENIYEPSRNI